MPSHLSGVRSGVLLVAVAVVACSSAASRPAPFGDCVDAVACRSARPSLSIGGGGGGGGGECGDLVSSDTVCQRCITEACCAQDEACSNEPQCLALLTCLQSCTVGNQPCIATCRDKSPNGIATYDGFESCLDTGCALACGGGSSASDAGASCGEISSPNATCQACLTRSCCTSASTCSANADCLGILTCVQACAINDTACPSACRDARAAGRASYDALTTCIETSCGAACT